MVTLSKIYTRGGDAGETSLGSGVAGKAIANVRDNFSKANMCTKTLDVYDEVLGIRPAG